LDDDGNIVSQSQSPSAEVNLNEMKQMEQIKAMEMGRTQITQEDLIIVYDANVSYFFWNQGNGKQQFVIQKIKNNNVTYLTTLDTKYSLLKDVKSGKYNLTLSCPDNGNMKSFLVLSITEDQMVLADLEYKEIQFFNKTTR
jgi:hypothetical protein